MLFTLFNKIIRPSLILIVFGCSFALAKAQSIKQEQDVNKDTIISEYENKMDYFGGQIGFGGIFQNATGGKSLKFISSSVFQSGVYYKLRANYVYNVLAHASYSRLIYSFNTASVDIHYEELVLNNASLGLMNRFNIGKKGNFNYYFSVGASAEYTISNKMRIKMDAAPGSDSRFSKISKHNLDYINKLNYNAELRIGLNKVVVFGKYRLTNLIKKSQNFLLPPTMVGLMLTLGISQE